MKDAAYWATKNFPPGCWLDDEDEDNRQRRRRHGKRKRIGRVHAPRSQR